MKKLLCNSLGGSHAYGLNTPESDIDYRGVFINTDPAEILGLSRFEVVQKQEEEDIVQFEVRKFFELLKKGNTGALEILFTPREKFIDLAPEFEHVLANRLKFVSTERMFSCLRGYMQGERKLANGERTGKLGGKRKEMIDRYGFSPKNWVQLFRLAHCGITLFQEGHFPVNVMEHNPDLGAQLLDIKVNPSAYNKDQLNSDYEKAEAALVEAYETRKYEFVFDEDRANDSLRRLYLPYLT